MIIFVGNKCYKLSNKYFRNDYHRSKKHRTQMTKILELYDCIEPCCYEYRHIFCGMCCRPKSWVVNILGTINICEDCGPYVTQIKRISKYEYICPKYIPWERSHDIVYWNLSDGFSEGLMKECIKYNSCKKKYITNSTVKDYNWSKLKDKMFDFSLLPELNRLIYKFFIDLIYK